jgi:hypothetical protein
MQLRLTLKSGIVVEGVLAKQQAQTEVPSITLVTNYAKKIKEYKVKTCYPSGQKHDKGYDKVEYRSYDYIEVHGRENTNATVFTSTILKQEEIK